MYTGTRVEKVTQKEAKSEQVEREGTDVTGAGMIKIWGLASCFW